MIPRVIINYNNQCDAKKGELVVTCNTHVLRFAALGIRLIYFRARAHTRCAHQTNF